MGARAGEHSMKRLGPPAGSASNPFRKADRRTAAEPDRGVEQREGGCAFGPRSERGVAMRSLVGAELVYHRRELGIVAVVLEPIELARIVAVDLLLDRRGAGHRRLRPEQR